LGLTLYKYIPGRINSDLQKTSNKNINRRYLRISRIRHVMCNRKIKEAYKKKNVRDSWAREIVHLKF
jgi:hypothetical protein